MSKLRHIRKQRLYEQVLEALAQYVADERLSVGDHLPPERALSEQLGISRASLKQALIALEVQGLIETQHGGGSYLRSTDLVGESLDELMDRKDRLPDILDAREALETKLASLAAARRTDTDSQELQASLDYMQSQVDAQGDVESADARFHKAVASAAHSGVLTGFMGQLADQIAESRKESLRQPGRPAQSLTQHRKIAENINAGDAAAAEESMRLHLSTVRDTLLLNWQPDS